MALGALSEGATSAEIMSSPQLFQTNDRPSAPATYVAPLLTDCAGGGSDHCVVSEKRKKKRSREIGAPMLVKYRYDESSLKMSGGGIQLLKRQKLRLFPYRQIHDAVFLFVAPSADGTCHISPARPPIDRRLATAANLPELANHMFGSSP
ncbi:hypothetical protein CC78DRAFT_577198 [Lojkania enalia]|uniref:Uncharacterized protein n=1 Tax=Lojkania enalia TaxID=147567 RepID=A0A9P4KG21_9PLEO|nr:hypothetical protein CC78DRAFT_577198 [Didymosphaeria enalia]